MTSDRDEIGNEATGNQEPGTYAGDGLPPGHPAGSDTTVSAGEALSGRERRSDAVVQADQTLDAPEPEDNGIS